jgi:type I restriction enzyme, S subunit
MAEWKETEVGRIPKHWVIQPTSKFCLAVKDGTHDSPKQQKVGEFLITSRHITEGRIDLSKAYRISKEEFDKANRRSKVDRWDVLLTMIGTVGEVVLVKEEPNFAIKNIGLFKCGEETKARWLTYFLNSPNGRSLVSVRQAGTTQEYITLDHLRNLPVFIPPPNEQNAIINVLSSLDDKIDLLHRQNKTLEALAETLFRQWFVQRPELAEGEEAGETRKFGDLIRTTSGGTPSRHKPEYYHNGTIRWVKSKELSGSFIFETEEHLTEDALKNSSAKLLPQNSILIAMYGATVGEYAILADPATCNQAVCAIIPNADYPYTYLFSFIKYNKEYIKSVAVGSAQQNISQLLIKDLEVAAPNSMIQEYHSEVESYFQKIKFNHRQIRTLTQLRDTLLPKLMSGEVRVK